MPASVEISPSKGLDPSTLERTGKIRKIEVLSPSDVGPTFEMKVEDKKLTFRMADSKEVRSSNLKRDAGNMMVGLQSKLVALTGLGGEVPSLQDKMKLVASHYRDADYERAVSIIKEIDDRLSSEEFKKDILIRVQRRMSDYQGLGADTTKAKDHFRSLATSLKDGREDFYPLVSLLVKGLEDLIKGLGIEEVAVEVIELTEEVVEEAPHPKIGESPPEPPKEVPGKDVQVAKSLEPVAPAIVGEAPKDAPVQREELRPVVKFVKKKLTLVPDGASPTPGREGLSPEQALEPKVKDTSPVPVASAQTPEAQKALAKEGAVPDPVPGAEAVNEEKAAKQKEAMEAFNRIQIVHKAATALHKKGKDVGQIFDLLRFAEEARKKGELKTYVGVSKQLESMLLSMQSKK